MPSVVVHSKVVVVLLLIHCLMLLLMFMGAVFDPRFEMHGLVFFLV